MVALVTATDVSKRFVSRSGTAVDALAPCSIAIEDGEFLSLIGPSGCGKSTLLRILAGLIAPTAGTVNWTSGAPTKGGEIGFVFQEAVLLPWLTILQNIRFPLDMFGTSRKEADDLARQMLELVGLKGFENALPKELSGGMRQRTAIARALVYRPRIVLMDEPFGALDLLTRDRMNDELLRIREDVGATIVFVTHSIEEAAYLSDRVAVMSARPGRISTIHTIDLPKPRSDSTKDTREFFDWLSRLRKELK